MSYEIQCLVIDESPDPARVHDALVQCLKMRDLKVIFGTLDYYLTEVEDFVIFDLVFLELPDNWLESFALDLVTLLGSVCDLHLTLYDNAAEIVDDNGNSEPIARYDMAREDILSLLGQVGKESGVT